MDSFDDLEEAIVEYMDRGIVLIIADILSLITVSSCLFIKIPQINTIRQNKSSQGISVFGLCLELFSYTVMMSYNYTNGYEFLSYMEYPILLLQELNSSLFYMSSLPHSSSMKLFPVIILQFLVPFCTPIGATSKVLQLVAILRSKDASSVSRTTWALSAFTNFTRIYTVYVQSHDWMLLSNFMISTFLSSSVFVAACVYKKKPKKE
ncbi:PQ-loop repeat-containing protein 3 [Lucilia cuprina]|nr:PQ-loop repeat-containing protein 3 [Lucilia cuprina]